MTPVQFAALVRYKTKTNSTTFTDADILALANPFKDEIAAKIQERRPEVWNMPAVGTLVADQREYSFPDDVLNRLVYVELDLDDDGKYVLANPVQRLQFRDGLTEDEIVSGYGSDPRYFLRRNAINLLCKAIIDVVDGIRIVYDSFPADLASLGGVIDMSIDPTDTTHGFPRQFHELLARRLSVAYKSRNEVPLDPEDLAYSGDLEKALDNYAIAVVDESYVGALPTDPDNSDQGYEN